MEALGQSTKICDIEAQWLLNCRRLCTVEVRVYTHPVIKHHLFFFLSALLLICFYVDCLGVLHYIMSSLFSFSVLHACFYYFMYTYHFHFTWSIWLFATNLSCQHLDFSMPELQLQLCLGWDQHDWPFMPSIKSVSERYLVCWMHDMTIIVVLDKDAQFISQLFSARLMEKMLFFLFGKITSCLIILSVRYLK